MNLFTNKTRIWHKIWWGLYNFCTLSSHSLPIQAPRWRYWSHYGIIRNHPCKVARAVFCYEPSNQTSQADY